MINKKNMKLISMTDFVLEQAKNAPLEEYNQVNETFVNKVVEYASFLKQPLKLEMFVPCDEDGNLLEEIIFSEQVHIYLNYQEKQDYVKRCDVYKKAKEKVLFEGFELVSETEETWCFKIKGEFPRLISKKGQIEWLKSYNNITLTPNAIKQLGLNK